MRAARPVLVLCACAVLVGCVQEATVYGIEYLFREKTTGLDESDELDRDVDSVYEVIEDFYLFPSAIPADPDDFATVGALLAAGADKDATEEEGWAALSIASQGGHLAMVQALLAAGADKDATEEEGCTALLIASQKGHRGPWSRLCWLRAPTRTPRHKMAAPRST